MRAEMATADDLTCKELVELVTDYLEGALRGAARARFESHLEICEGCATYVEQMRQTIRVVGRLDEDSIDPAVRERLLDAFRSWKAT